MSKIDLVLQKLKGIRKTNQGWTALCPAHEDHQNSLSISEAGDGKVLLKCFAGCSAEQIVQSLGLKMSDLFPDSPIQRDALSTSKTTATVQQSLGCTLEQYAQIKKIPVDFLIKLGLSDETHKGSKRVVIPYLNIDQELVAIRYRCALAKSDGINQRFKWRTNDKASLYGLWKLKEFKSQKFVILVEGESDCHTLWLHGFPAIGIPGAAIWKEEWFGFLENFEIIYVVHENDRGGEAVLKWIAKSKLKIKIRILDLTPHKDPSDLHVAKPDEFKIKFQTFLERSIPWTKIEEENNRKQTEKTWKTCRDLATHPNILEIFDQELEKSGVVGVQSEAKILYLTLTSHILNKPISIVIKGPSSTGKSYLVENVLKFFPEEAYYELTGMSEKVLAYTQEPLEHRMLIIIEAVGLNNEMTSYLIRSLLSEGKISYETVEKTPLGLVSRRIEKQGPTGLIVTTTAVSLHPENETRLFSITLKDTPKQTQEILLSLTEERKSSSNIELWHALQEWLSCQPNHVVIPYLPLLIDKIPPKAVRLRRDIPQVINFIKTHAILHQANRDKDQKGSIIASLDDYKAIYELVKDILKDQIDAGVSDSLKETVDAVKALLDGKDSEDKYVSQSETKNHLKLDRSSTSRRIRVALEKGYLKNLETQKGKPHKLVLGDSLPEDVEILPSPEKLDCCTVAVETGGINDA